jgi:replicative DNA helicase
VDLDVMFVSAVLTEGKPALRHALEQGITTEHLSGAGAEVFTFVCAYTKEYGDIPTTDIVAGKTGIELPPVEGKAAFFTSEVLNRKLHIEMMPKVRDWAELLEQAKPREMVSDAETTLRRIRQEYRTARVESLTRMGEEVWDDYQKMKQGLWGIEIPWPTINEATLGMWPEDLILFVARVGVGKSWTGLMLAQHAWALGKRVLFVTTEMARLNIARRFIALHLKLPFKQFRRGQLGEFVEQKVTAELKALAEKDGFYIIGGDFNFTFEDLESAIDEAEPDLLIVDGAYLMKAQGATRTERAAAAFDELKRVGKRHKIPVIATSQFNREVKNNAADTISLERIALTDTASWNADVVIAINRTEDMRRDNKAEMRVLKNREGVTGDPVIMWWNFDEMRFDELPKTGGGDADEFGTGMPASMDPENLSKPDPFAF